MNPVIEGFRGAAAMLVLLHHYAYGFAPDAQSAVHRAHFGHNGVDLFFVITGFLFAASVVGTRPLRTRDFLVRRAFRLLPLYTLSLLATAAVMRAQPDIGMHLARHLLFIQTLPTFPVEEAGTLNLVYWTLPVEVHYYLLIALLAVLVPRHGSVRARVCIMGVVSALAWWVVFTASAPGGSGDWMQWQAQLPALLLEFWFGALLWATLPLLARSPRAPAALLAAGLTLLAVLWWSYPLVAEGTRAPRPFGPFNVLSALAYAMLLGGCLARWGGSCGSGWATRLAALAGSLSFGVYLFHDLAMRSTVWLLPTEGPGVRTVFATVLTLTIAYVLHELMEVPLRSLGRLLGAEAPAGAAPASAVVAIAPR